MMATAKGKIVAISVFAAAAVFCAGVPVPEAQTQSTGPTLPPAEYKPLPVGTRVDYGAWKYEVEKSKGADIAVETNDGRLIHHYGVFGRSGYGAYLGGGWYSTLKGGAKSALDSLWPLTVGKKTRLTVKEEQSGYSGFPQLRSWTITLEVVGTENVVLGGVRYATYVVREQATYQQSGQYYSSSGGYSRTLWYHPPAGLVLKTALKWTAGPNSGDDEDIDKLFRVRYPEGTTDLALKGEPIPAEGVAVADLGAERAKQETAEKYKAEIARLTREAGIARLTHEAEIARLTHEAEIERLTREAEIERLTREAEIERLTREAEASRGNEASERKATAEREQDKRVERAQGTTAGQKLTDASKTKLSGAEIQELWASGTKIDGMTDAGTAFIIQHFSDGKATVDWDTFSDRGSDKGTWRVKGDKSCKKWKKLYQGSERCWTIYKVGPKKYESYLRENLNATWYVVK